MRVFKKYSKNVYMRNYINPYQVHNVLKQNMLVDGFPLVYDPINSHGYYLKDAVTGKNYLDAFSFFGSQPISHNHPELYETKFVKKMELAKYNPSNSDFYTIEMAEFVKKFSKMCVMENFKYLHFVSGGTLAVENALKTAFDRNFRLNNGKINENMLKILHFKNCFHGRSGYCMSMTNTDPVKYKYFPKFDWPRMDYPAIDFSSNDAEELKNRETTIMTKIIGLLKSQPEISAIIVEPIQCEGGDNHMSADFYKFLRDITEYYDKLFILDEVQTGIGLTGKMWCYEHFNYKTPDIICFGKKTQVCGIMVSDKLDNLDKHVFNESSRINSTWGGNLTDMIRATKHFEIIEKYDLIKNSEIRGAELLSLLQSLSIVYPIITNVRGKGLLCSFDLPDKKIRDKFINVAFENNVLLLGAGEKTIRLRPYLDVNEEFVAKLYSSLYMILKKFI